MPLIYTELDANNVHTIAPLLLPFLEREWSKQYSEEVLNWRFLKQPRAETILALNDDQCVAMINSWIRPYAIGGAQTDVRETDLWISAPEYRPFASLRVLQALMEKPQPISCITNMEYINNILERLSWRRLPDVSHMVLPVRAGAFAKTLATHMRRDMAPLPGVVKAPFRLKIRSPKAQPAPAGVTEILEITRAEDTPAIMPPDGVYASASLATRRDFEWYAQAPKEFGEFVWLLFKVDGEPIALSISRIYEDGSFIGSKILQVQASTDGPDVYAWVFGETSVELADRGAHWIDARFSCPKMVEALRKIGFMRGQVSNVFWCDGEQPGPKGHNLVSCLFRGDGVAPYPVK